MKNVRIVYFRILSVVVLLMLGRISHADTLNLETCFERTRKNFPLQAQQALYDQMLSEKIRSWERNWLPKIALHANASYQSDVPELAISIPGQSLQLDLPRDRYQLYAELNQTIYDGGMSKVGKEIDLKETEIGQQKIKIGEKQLEEHVIRLYFAFLTLQKQKEIMKLTESLLDSRMKLLHSLREEGVADLSGELRLKAELLKLKRAIREVNEQFQVSLELMETLIGRPLGSETYFSLPVLEKPAVVSVERPELRMLELQQEKMEVSSKWIESAKKPKIGAFARGGVGYPNPFNFFDNAVSPYYIFGASLTWSLVDWGDAGRKKSILELQRAMLEKEKENTMRNFEMKLLEQSAKSKQLKRSMESLEEELKIQEQLRKIEDARLKEGTIREADYLEAVISEKQVRMELEMMRIQLSLTEVNYQYINGSLFK
ncbi:MAG: TolC family protein [Bacteroidetes bacterium]|nr:MAG: TolC family protein [Bacteroidota bacterium]